MILGYLGNLPNSNDLPRAGKKAISRRRSSNVPLPRLCCLGGGWFPDRSGGRTDPARSGRKWRYREAHPTHRGAWYYRAMSAS